MRAPIRPSVLSVLTPYVCSVLFSNVLAVFVSECIFVVCVDISRSLSALTMNISIGSYPLFAFTPIPLGGLGLSEALIGIHMALRALSNILVMTLYPSIERRLGTVRTFQLSMWLWPVTVLGFPILGAAARSLWIKENTWVMWVLLCIVWVVWSAACFIWCACRLCQNIHFWLTCRVAGMGIMVNNAAPSEEALATMNVSFALS